MYLTKRINLRQIREWKMQLAIAQNPYTKKPQELWKIIDQFDQKDYSEERDVAGIENLKRVLTKNPRFKVKS